MEKHGVRKSKNHRTREDAVVWAAHIEGQLDGAKSRFLSMEDLGSLGLTVNTAIPISVLEATRELPYSLNEIVLSSIPTKLSSGIYFLLRGNRVVYVGQSVDVLGRISRHRRDGRQFGAFAYIECHESDMDRLERLYIRAFVPEENTSFGNKVNMRSGGGVSGYSAPRSSVNKGSNLAAQP